MTHTPEFRRLCRRLVSTFAVLGAASAMLGTTSRADQLEARRAALESAALAYDATHHRCPTLRDLQAKGFFKRVTRDDERDFVITCVPNVKVAVRPRGGCL